jgi:hypothetical protein
LSPCADEIRGLPFTRFEGPGVGKKRTRLDKQASVTAGSRLRAAVLGPRRGVTGAVAIVAVFLGAWYAVWSTASPHALASKEFWLSWQDIDITPADPRPDRDIRAEVFHGASVDGPLSLLDPDLTRRVADAFSLHPWVARVCRVSKHYPARVCVELEYRRPVCMVDVMGELLPVDAEGVSLPKEDFSAAAASSLPLLKGVDTYPIGPVGTPWGDVRVLGGAEIAAALAPVWQDLGLRSIVPSALVEVGRSDEPQFDLMTAGGTRIPWGHAPGAERPGDTTAHEKIARLTQFWQENGSLESWAGTWADGRPASDTSEAGSPPWSR